MILNQRRCFVRTGEEISMNAHVPLSPSMESLLAAYASGHLGHGMSVLMASFLTLSPVARRQMETFETLNGVLLDNTESVEMASDSLAGLMTRLDMVDSDENHIIANCNDENSGGEDGNSTAGAAGNV